MALPEFPWLGRCLTGSGMAKELVAMQVERESLEKPANLEHPIAAPGEHFHPVVEALDGRVLDLDLIISNRPAKLIAIDKQANDGVVHLHRFGKADGLARQTLDARA